VTGTVTDPVGGPTAIDRVEVWVFGERGSQTGTNLGTVKPQSSGLWMVVLSPTRFPSTHGNMYVYAHSTLTNRETLATTEFNIIDRCIPGRGIDCPTT
jgi:hypothetical protein